MSDNPTQTTPGTTLASQLAAADRQGRKLTAASLTPPATLADAIAVQAETLALDGLIPGGLKLGIWPDGISVSAPLAPVSHASASGTAGFERPAFDSIEVEICFVLGRDLTLTGSADYTRESLLGCIGGIYSGVEFLRNRLDDGSRSAPFLFVADRLSNAGYLLGEELADDILEPGLSIPLSITINGQTVFPGPGKHPTVDPLAPLLAYVNAPENGGKALLRGQIMTTGSLCGLIPLPARAAVAISGFTTLTVTASATVDA